jgi:hypothetical protein
MQMIRRIAKIDANQSADEIGRAEFHGVFPRN